MFGSTHREENARLKQMIADLRNDVQIARIERDELRERFKRMTAERDKLIDAMLNRSMIGRQFDTRDEAVAALRKEVGLDD